MLQVHKPELLYGTHKLHTVSTSVINIYNPPWLPFKSLVKVKGRDGRESKITSLTKEDLTLLLLLDVLHVYLVKPGMYTRF